MNNLNEKIKLYFRKRTQRVSIFGLSVLVDWYFILLCFAALTIFGLAYSYLSYSNISSGEAFLGENAVEGEDQTQVKKSKIEKTVEFLEQR